MSTLGEGGGGEAKSPNGTTEKKKSAPGCAIGQSSGQCVMGGVGCGRGGGLQLRRVQASVEVAAKVTAALARYDVHGAEKAIDDGAGGLPVELVDSHRQLLSNLCVYRDYLPDALLQVDDDGSRCSTVQPPA
eukprot:Hpha_TRINITY_DN16324_c1_g2::TRINITY_DN16324_c1_g2_i1::g.58360::m.58360